MPFSFYLAQVLVKLGIGFSKLRLSLRSPNHQIIQSTQASATPPQNNVSRNARFAREVGCVPGWPYAGPTGEVDDATEDGASGGSSAKLSASGKPLA